MKIFNMKRRKFIRQAAFTSAGLYLSKYVSRFSTDFPVVRIAPAKENLKAPAVENAIDKYKKEYRK